MADEEHGDCADEDERHVGLSRLRGGDEAALGGGPRPLPEGAANEAGVWNRKGVLIIP